MRRQDLTKIRIELQQIALELEKAENTTAKITGPVFVTDPVACRLENVASDMRVAMSAQRDRLKG